MSGNRVTALIIVALIHIFVIYALVTGLAYSAYQKAVERVTTVDVKEPEKPKPPPPPPPKQKVETPPIVAPPVKIDIAPAPPQLPTVTTPPPPAPIVLAPPAPAPPPAPARPAVGATPRGDPQSWVSTDDYPARALRENREGVTSFRMSVGADGRPSDCQITNSSGSADLDQTVCSLMMRRARFKPAMGSDGQPMVGTFVRSFRWQIPKD